MLADGLLSARVTAGAPRQTGWMDHDDRVPHTIPGAGVTIEEFAPDDARMTEFAAVFEQVGQPALDEPVQPDARCLLARDYGGRAVARLSFATAVDLHGAPGLSGIIGHYESTSSAAAVVMLRDAVTELRIRGAVRVLGPMNGSTWGRYRFVLPAGGADEEPEPPFLTEPTNPPRYPLDFQEAGFVPVSMYESAIVEDLAAADPRREALAEGLRARGIVIRPVNLGRFDEEVRALYALSLVAFARNRYYSPISFDEFRVRYDPLRAAQEPDLVRVAEDGEGRALGFVLAFPDLLTMEDGRPTRIVLKTLATAPEARGLGLGTFLTDEIRRLAHEKGYASVIHALMQADNASVSISRHTARVFRRYALYGWAPGSA